MESAPPVDDARADAQPDERAAALPEWDASIASAAGEPEAPLGEGPGPVRPLGDPIDDSRGWRWLSAAVVVACCAAVLAAVHPELILRNTTAAGGDMGAHVWFPAFMRDHLLGHLRIAGWAPDWYAGFPAGQFYFPLPALLVLLLDVALPYNVAFKIVTVLGIVGMPAAAYAFGRGLGARRPTPEMFAVASVLFLFFKGAPGSAPDRVTQAFNQRIMGGTIISTLAGEYSFAIALTLGLCALAALAVALDRRRRIWLPAVLLAATVTSHLVVGLFVGVAALIVWATARRPIRRLPLAAAIGAVAALLTAGWSVPLLATFSYTANMRYERLTEYRQYLLPSYMWWVIALAVVGLVLGLRRRDRTTLVLALLAAITALVFTLWPELHVWNLRFLPFWYLELGLLAAIGVAETLRLAADLASRAWTLRADDEELVGSRRAAAEQRRVVVVQLAVVGVCLAVIAGGVIVRSHRTRGFMDFWSEWNYSGYQDTRAGATRAKAWPEYRKLIDTMDALPPGRAMWEGGGALENYGTPLALELLPYWTHGRIQSMEGLYFESAATTPYHFMAVSPLSAPGNASNPVRGLDYRQIGDFNLGVQWLQTLGVNYYMAYSPEAKAAADRDARLVKVATSPDLDGQAPNGWSIYRVRDSALVAPLRQQPVVVSDPKGLTQPECFHRRRAQGERAPRLDPWECLAAGWFNDPASLTRPLTSDGPSEWDRATQARALDRRRIGLPANRVTNIRTTEDSITFRVSRPGQPVIVRTSYFPNWRAEGARGPYRATPNFMVVVPTGNEVTLRYVRSGPEWVGILLELAGVVGLIALIVWGRRLRDEARAEEVALAVVGAPVVEPVVTDDAGDAWLAPPSAAEPPPPPPAPAQAEPVAPAGPLAAADTGWTTLAARARTLALDVRGDGLRAEGEALEAAAALDAGAGLPALRDALGRVLARSSALRLATEREARALLGLAELPDAEV